MSTLSLADRITRLSVAVEGNGDPEGGSRDRAGLPAGGERRSVATAPSAQRQLRPAGPCRHNREPLPARTHARPLQCLREPIAAGNRASPPQRPSAVDSGPLRRPAPARGRRRAHNLALVLWTHRDACPHFLTDPCIRAGSRSGSTAGVRCGRATANEPMGSEFG